MTQDARKLAAIVQLSEAAFAASQARMGALKRQEMELRESISALHGKRQPETEDTLSSPAARAGADLLWQRWAEGRRTKLNVELAKTLVAQANAKSAMAKDFGRCEAIKSVRDELAAVARTKMNRRAERNG